jgi:hypothetical protein
LGIGSTTTGRTYEYPRSPPGDLEGIRRYYSERGYSQDPLLELKEEGQVASFVKPIAGETGEERHHVRVLKGRKYYTIDEHVDPHDPGKNPVGHFVDITGPPPPHHRTRIPKND